MFKKIASVTLVLSFLFLSPLQAEASRSSKKIGLSLGFLTEPFPSLVGYNLSYNLFQQLRLGVGYGSISSTSTTYTASLTTLAFDVKGFLVNWNFAPFVDLGYSSVTGSVSGTASSGLSSLSSTGTSLYYGAGIDWQTDFGFNIGVEVKHASFNSASISLPGFYVGWYF